MPILKCHRPAIRVHTAASAPRAAGHQRQARGRTWRVIRDRVLQRDCGLCQECRRNDRLRAACEVDHILPVWKGGTDDDANLESLCHDCHAKKTAAEQRERSALNGSTGAF